MGPAGTNQPMILLPVRSQGFPRDVRPWSIVAAAAEKAACRAAASEVNTSFEPLVMEIVDLPSCTSAV